MKVGIPRALLYYKYNPFFETFYSELGCEIIESPETNRDILDYASKYCVDEACLPIKIFHGHVYYLKDKCDMILVPRIMRVNDKEYICPKFCGLPEMIENSIYDLPPITKTPIYANNKEKLLRWANREGGNITKNKIKIKRAFNNALREQGKYACGVNDEGYKTKVVLAGHPYSVNDSFLNMDVIKKLNNLGIGVITEEFVSEEDINYEVDKLFKRPFWTFTKDTYGSTVYLADNQKVDGIVYISSFGCGIDSVLIELIKNNVGDFPFLILKVDEHTGEVGFNTRIEAFSDMLLRRRLS